MEREGCPDRSFMGGHFWGEIGREECGISAWEF